MNNNLPLPDIRAFIAIAQQGSFTKASSELGVSRAHLSRQLNQLEQQLNVQLLIRTTRSQRLTQAGKLFFEQCQNALQSIEQAIESTQDHNQQIHGQVRINSVGGMIGEELLSQVISNFSSQHPRVDIDVDFSSERVDLIANEFDLVLRMGSLEDSGLIARKVTELDIGTWASPKYLTHHDELTHPKQLINHNCLTGSVKRWHFISKRKNKKPIEIAVKGNFNCKNGRALLNAALHHQGIVRLPRIYCQQALQQHKLVEVFQDWQCSSVPLYLLYHKNPYMPARLTALIDHIYQSFVAIFANEQN
jgi:DNA-binding transcriptional LysR family regulator